MLTQQPISWVGQARTSLSITGRIFCGTATATPVRCDLMGVNNPRSRGPCAKLWSLLNAHGEEPPAMNVTTIGIDLAKHVFQIHGVDGP